MTADKTPPKKRAWTRRWTQLTLFCLVGVTFLGGAIAWTYWSNYRKFPPDRADKEALAWPLPDMPSVAVLPIAAVGRTDQDELAATQLAADMIDLLARVPGLFVIAPETSGRFQGGQFRIKATAEALGVEYLATGTMTHTTGNHRVYLKVIDVFTGQTEWSDDFDVPRHDLVKVLGRGFEDMLDALDIDPVEKTLALPSLGAATYEGWIAYREAIAYRVPSDAGSMANSLSRLEEAAKADPKWSAIPTEIAWTYLTAAQRGWTHDGWGGPEESAARGVAAARRAVSLDPDDPEASARLADLLAFQGKTQEALEQRARAAKLGRNSFAIQWALAQTLIKAERYDEALPVMRRALRLHPRHPVALLQALAELEFQAGELDAAFKSLDTVIDRRPAAEEPRLMRVYIHGSSGNWEAAEAEAKGFLSLYPGFGYGEWSTRRAARGRDARPEWRDIMRRAGIPD